MEFLQKHLKLLAGAAILLLTLAWLAWPQGDLNRAARLLDRGEYAEAVLLLRPIARQRPNSQGVQLLYARALIGAGRLDQARSLLKKMHQGGLNEELRQVIVVYILEQAAIEQWDAAIEGWLWACADSWQPPFEDFQTHLAMGLLTGYDFEARGDPNLLEFLQASLDPIHPLARLATLTQGDEVDPDFILGELAYLKACDWQAYGRQATEFAGRRMSIIHMHLISKDLVGIGEGLDPWIIDYLIAASWDIEKGSNGSHQFSTVAGRVWQAALSGALTQTGSEAAASVSGSLAYKWQLDTHAQGPSSVYWRWSADGAYLTVYDTTAHPLINRPGIGQLTIIQGMTGQAVLELPSFNFVWSSKGSSFLQILGGNHALYQNPEAIPVPVKVYSSNIMGWLFDNKVYSRSGSIIDLESSLVDYRLRDTFYFEDYPRLYVSAADLVLSVTSRQSLLYDRRGKVLQRVGHQELSSWSYWVPWEQGQAGLRTYWSPSGNKLLYVDEGRVGPSRIVTKDGIYDLPLPVNSYPLGWLDEEHLLIKRNLGFPHQFYIYSLATGEVAYVTIPGDNPYSLYPAGDGETVAWFSQGRVYLGKLRFLD